MIELDSRMSGSFEVTLLWNRRANTVTVEVVNWETEERLLLRTPPDLALEVFRHPFAYAPADAGQLILG